MSVETTAAPILILGAGIHGVAVARELLLNGMSVVLIDAGDLASGATSKSSRLIHGGLRYLEYGDVNLVKESLAERKRNLELAPCFVAPLRLYIPLEASWSGLIPSAVGFLGGQRTALGRALIGPRGSRGYWPVRAGLSMYDWLAGDDVLPPSASVDLLDPAAPWVNTQRYRSLVAYSDAQMLYPERVVLALLADAEQIARASQLSFRLGTYAHLERAGTALVIASPLWADSLTVSPALIVNASGAAGDETLAALGIATPPLLGGTKGSHVLTWHPELKRALNGQAVYAEASDGRPVFTLPFDDGVLIGTTDVPYQGVPSEAVASEEEIAYLLDMVWQVFGIALSRDDVVAHYCGVRPLPRSNADQPGAISRDHSLVWHHQEGVPVLTLVGGKLTTWRAFGEQVTDHVLGKLGRQRIAQTRLRRLPGNAALTSETSSPADLWQSWVDAGWTDSAEAAALWKLLGTRAADVLRDVSGEPREPIADSPLTRRVVCWLIRHEHVARLEDLVERRLLSVFQQRLTPAHLHDLAQCLVACGKLEQTELTAAVTQTQQRLQQHYGRRFPDHGAESS